MQEIEATLQRYGCKRFARFSDMEKSIESIAWEIEGAGYRLTIQVPESAKADQIRRQRWRAALLAIKATLEWSEQMGEPVVGYMLPHLVLWDGRTMAETAASQVPAIAGRGWSALLEGKS